MSLRRKLKKIKKKKKKNQKKRRNLVKVVQVVVLLRLAKVQREEGKIEVRCRGVMKEIRVIDEEEEKEGGQDQDEAKDHVVKVAEITKENKGEIEAEEVEIEIVEEVVEEMLQGVVEEMVEGIVEETVTKVEWTDHVVMKIEEMEERNV